MSNDVRTVLKELERIYEGTMSEIYTLEKSHMHDTSAATEPGHIKAHATRGLGKLSAIMSQIVKNVECKDTKIKAIKKNMEYNDVLMSYIK